MPIASEALAEKAGVNLSGVILKFTKSVNDRPTQFAAGGQNILSNNS